MCSIDLGMGHCTVIEYIDGHIVTLNNADIAVLD